MEALIGKPTVTLVGEAVAGEAAKTRNQLEQLIQSVNKSAFDIGLLLHTIKSKGYYDGFTTFQEYVKGLPIKTRKAQYLRRIAEVMQVVNISRETYEPLGIAKLREITSLDPQGVWVNPESKLETPISEFIVGFVEKGNDLSLDEIKQHCRTLKGLVGENDLTWLNLQLKRAVLDNIVRPALELAKNAIGSVGKDDEGVSQDASDGAALEVISVEFLNNPANNILSDSEEEKFISEA